MSSERHDTRKTMIEAIIEDNEHLSDEKKEELANLWAIPANTPEMQKAIWDGTRQILKGVEGVDISINAKEAEFAGVKDSIISHLQAAYNVCPEFFLQRGVKGVYLPYDDSIEMPNSVWDIFMGRQKKA